MLPGKDKSRLIIKYSNLIILVALALSVAGGYYSSKLTLESNLTELLPDDFESVKALNRIKDEVGGVSHLRIILESSRYEALKEFADTLASDLRQNHLINYVDYKNDVRFYKKNALLLLDLDELDSLEVAVEEKIDAEKQKLNPLFVDDLFGDDEEESEDKLSVWQEKYRDKEPGEYYINSDSTILVIKVYPVETSASLSFVEKMIGEVQQLVEAANPAQYADDMKVYYGGGFKNRLDEYQVVKKDITGTAIYGFGGVFLLIILYFRRLTGALLITFTLLCSLTWTFGLTYLVIGSLNTITGFLFVILFGLGVDYGIHAFARYRESRRSGLTFEAAIDKMVNQTGKALTTTAVTTSAAFFSLTLMEFKGFSDLGFISGTGILFALIAMIVFLPALLTLLEKYRLLKFRPAEAKNHSFVRQPFKHSKPVLLAGTVLTLLTLYTATQIDFEYDFTNLRAITAERKLVGEKTRGVFKLSESPAVVLAESPQEIHEVVAAVKEIIAADTLSPTVNTVRSIFSLVPQDQSEKLLKIKEIRDLVDHEAEGVFTGKDKERLDEFRGYLQVERPFTWAEFPQKDKRQFINKKGEIGNFVFIYPKVALRHGKNAIDFRDDIGVITTASGKTFHASSSNIILADMLTIMIREGRWAVALTMVVVFMIVLLDFRSFKAALLVLAPLVLGVLWITGIMHLLGMKWNLFNIVVIPSIIGIGVDNGVHIYHRYVEEGRGSLIHVLRNTGVAILMTTLTTMVGYSGLTVAHHPGLNSIGKLALIGISSTFLTAIVILPAALQFVENRAGGVRKPRKREKVRSY
ncbi:MAG: RND family transporter [bacterium]